MEARMDVQVTVRRWVDGINEMTATTTWGVANAGTVEERQKMMAKSSDFVEANAEAFQRWIDYRTVPADDESGQRVATLMDRLDVMLDDIEQRLKALSESMAKVKGSR